MLYQPDYEVGGMSPTVRQINIIHSALKLMAVQVQSREEMTTYVEN